MSHAFDWSWVGEAVRSPELSLDAWVSLPEDVTRRIEVENGRVIYCQSPTLSHQGIQASLRAGLRDSAKKSDAEDGRCHKVTSEVDVLLSEVPFHYRKPDVTVFRCLPKDRPGARWFDKPLVSDVVIAVEIVSRSTIVDDLQTKRAVYADAGIPHYWIIRMTGDNGPAVRVERFVLTADRHYVSEGVSVRGKSPVAIDTHDPFPIHLTWEDLDADL